ncbi:B-cell receptor CD22-like isoform X1 [Denticeps clupeoides]|uniref:B-cell receptor CD22-like isoform X1 n=1 Tax=Denticeps clupeoides TaxID=299321 RepID=UPI0010A577AD|nr:B-cell receptor CD22-like isoform X1 [Denticeps clupeoides]
MLWDAEMVFKVVTIFLYLQGLVCSFVTHICALQGTSVTLPCANDIYTFLMPNVCSWYKSKENVPIIENPHYIGRVMKCDCSLMMNNLRENDSGSYRFLKQEVALSVTDSDLQLKTMDSTVTEGQNVTLTCFSTCTLRNSPIYFWYRDRQLATYTTGNKLHLSQVTSQDTGNYSCAVKGHENRLSSDVPIVVKYNPLDLSVSVSPSAEIVEGRSTILTCSSDVSTAVYNYTWYKKNGVEYLLIGSGYKYIITNARPEHSGLYRCVAERTLIHRSSMDVLITVKYSPRIPEISISPSGEIVEGSSVTLTCSSDAYPAVSSYMWYQKNGDGTVFRGTGKSINFTLASGDHGPYYCEAQNEIGAQNSDVVLLAGEKKSLLAVVVVGSVLAVLTVGGVIALTHHVKRKKSDPVGNTSPKSQDTHPISHDDTYTALNLKAKSSEYETLNNVRKLPCNPALQAAAEASHYENIQERISYL